jgi:hypothetical protein
MMHPPSPVPKKKTCLTITESTLKTFKETCRREAVPMNEKVEKFMMQYNQAHSLGNPQLKISVYAKPEEPQPMRVLCCFVDGAVSDGRVHCRRAGMWLPGVRCYSCDSNRLRKQKNE